MHGRAILRSTRPRVERAPQKNNRPARGRAGARVAKAGGERLHRLDPVLLVVVAGEAVPDLHLDRGSGVAARLIQAAAAGDVLQDEDAGLAVRGDLPGLVGAAVAVPEGELGAVRG